MRELFTHAVHRGEVNKITSSLYLHNYKRKGAGSLPGSRNEDDDEGVVGYLLSSSAFVFLSLHLCSWFSVLGFFLSVPCFVCVSFSYGPLFLLVFSVLSLFLRLVVFPVLLPLWKQGDGGVMEDWSASCFLPPPLVCSFSSSSLCFVLRSLSIYSLSIPLFFFPFFSFRFFFPFLSLTCARLPLPSFFKATDSPGGGNGRPPKCSVTDAFNEETHALAANG